MSRRLAVVLFLVIGGCLAEAEDAAGGPPPASTRTSLGFACPAGTAWRIASDVCAAVLGGPNAELGEPVIARTGSRIAIASVANVTVPQDAVGGLVGSLPGPPPQTTACRGFAVCLFTSRDGGATWQNTSLPTARQYYDPQILFTKEGRLIVATLAYGSGTATRIDVTSTADDGATWAPTVTASNHDRVDRPWLRAGASRLVLLYVADGGRDVRGAWSIDDGTTWTDGGRLPCRWPSPPVEVTPDSWVFLCSRTVDGPFRTLMFAWDPVAKTFEERSSLPWSRWFPIVVTDGGGRLIALTSHDDKGDASITFRRSDDQGATWGPAIDLRKGSPELHALRYSCIMAADLHDDGIVRIIVAGIEAQAVQGQLCLPRETRRFIWSADVDWTGGIVAVRPLGSPDRAPPVESADTPPVNDDFHSVADGAMAWSHDGVIAWTRSS